MLRQSSNEVSTNNLSIKVEDNPKSIMNELEDCYNSLPREVYTYVINPYGIAEGSTAPVFHFNSEDIDSLRCLGLVLIRALQEFKYPYLKGEVHNMGSELKIVGDLYYSLTYGASIHCSNVNKDCKSIRLRKRSYC